MNLDRTKIQSNQFNSIKNSILLGPYQADHEDANGQFEINWDYNDALVTADRVGFFKYMVKSVAEQHGLQATFMPKPFNDLTTKVGQLEDVIQQQQYDIAYLESQVRVDVPFPPLCPYRVTARRIRRTQ